MAKNVALQQLESLLKNSLDSSKASDVMGRLTDLGATVNDAVSELTAADLIEAGVPPLVARRIGKTMNLSDTFAKKEIVILDDNPVNLAARLKPEDLVQEYDPNDPTNPFGTRLKEISNGQKFLVFVDGKVEVLASQRLLRELLDGYGPRKTFLVGGAPTELYAVGECPARYADENPVAPGQMLRPDGYSDGNFPWGDVPLKVRQLILLISKGFAAASQSWNKSEADIYEMVTSHENYDVCFSDLCVRFPNQALEFKRLEECQSLPSMKVALQPKKK